MTVRYPDTFLGYSSREREESGGIVTSDSSEFTLVLNPVAHPTMNNSWFFKKIMHYYIYR